MNLETEKPSAHGFTEVQNDGQDNAAIQHKGRRQISIEHGQRNSYEQKNKDNFPDNIKPSLPHRLWDLPGKTTLLPIG